MSSEIQATEPVSRFRLIDAMVLVAAFALGCQAALILSPRGPTTLRDLLGGIAPNTPINWLEVVVDLCMFSLPIGTTMTLGHLGLLAIRPAATRRAFRATISGRTQVASSVVVSLIYISGCVVYFIEEVFKIHSLGFIYSLWTSSVILSPPFLLSGFLVALFGRAGEGAGWLGRLGKAIAAYWVIVIPVFGFSLMFLSD